MLSQLFVTPMIVEGQKKEMLQLLAIIFTSELSITTKNRSELLSMVLTSPAWKRNSDATAKTERTSMLNVKARNPQPLKFCKRLDVSKSDSFPGENVYLAEVKFRDPAPPAMIESGLESIVDHEGGIEARDSTQSTTTNQVPTDDKLQQVENSGTELEFLHRLTTTSMEWKNQEDMISSELQKNGESLAENHPSSPEISQGYCESFRRYISLKQLVRDLPVVPVDDQGLTDVVNAYIGISTSLALYQKERQQLEACAPDSFRNLTEAAEALCVLGASRKAQ